MFESFIGVNFWTALFVLLNTLAVFFVAKKFLFVPVKNMIDSRQQEIDAMYDEAKAAQERSAAMEQEYTQKLSAATQTGEQLVREAVARGQRREEEILRQANERPLPFVRRHLRILPWKRRRPSTMPRTRSLTLPCPSLKRWWVVRFAVRTMRHWWTALLRSWVSCHDRGRKRLRRCAV